ncbi:MAG: hypothetical protein JWQ36_1912 [Enterovirga sp.]|jgi:hypothetical protein|nr:hypothetical protein [Enterovirga sp.]
MKHKLATALVSLAALAQSGASFAQDARIPDLKGRWVGMSQNIMLGTTVHHDAPHQGPRLSSLEFVITIEGQDGRRFWGNVTSSPAKKESVVGVISADGKMVVAQDADGLVQGSIVDQDTMDLIYSHANSKSSVAATLYMKRDK